MARTFSIINLLGIVLIITGFVVTIFALHLFEIHTSGFWGFLQQWNPGNYFSLIPPFLIGGLMIVFGGILLLHTTETTPVYPGEKEI